MAAPGTDIAFNPSRTEGYRNFANKIWNAARFMFMNMDRIGVAAESSITPPNAKGVLNFEPSTLEDRWILSRFNRITKDVNEALEAFRFHEAANRIYDFFWGEFCDWYIELIKARLNSEDSNTSKAACTNLVSLFEASLRLLHPVMPFITEEIWQAVYDGKPPLKSIALAAFPKADEKQIDLSSETSMAVLQDLIVSVRNIRAELKVETKAKVPIDVFAHEPTVRALVEENRTALERLANVESIKFVDGSLAKLPGARATARFDVHVIYERKIDVAAECERLKKELEKAEKEKANNQRQLSNENFLAKAPAHVVDGLRRRAGELDILLSKLNSQLEQLQCGK
jgi:valyl-tRNA synthetase